MLAWRDALGFVAGQFLGAAAGAVALLFWGEMGMSVQYGATAVGVGVSAWTAFAGEVAATGFLVLVLFITAAHEPRIRAQACNHVSSRFADVVWRGLSTTHVAETLHDNITLEELRRHWAVISPVTYVDRFVGRDVATLIVWARYDMSFPPDLSKEFVANYARRGLRYREMVLPCGHYTTGVSPFKWMDGVGMARFLAKEL